MTESEEQWRRHLASSGFDLESIDCIVGTALTIVRWTEAGACEHAVALLVASHRKSWLTTDSIEKISSFMSGTMAGASLADIAFVVAMARVTDLVEKRLVESELVDYLDPDPAAQLFGRDPDDSTLASMILAPACIDDYAVPILSDAPGLM